MSEQEEFFEKLEQEFRESPISKLIVVEALRQIKGDLKISSWGLTPLITNPDNIANIQIEESNDSPYWNLRLVETSESEKAQKTREFYQKISWSLMFQDDD